MSDHWVTSKDRPYFVNGEILRKGYISTDPKPSPYNRQPVYEGYLIGETAERGWRRFVELPRENWQISVEWRKPVVSSCPAEQRIVFLRRNS